MLLQPQHCSVKDFASLFGGCFVKYVFLKCYILEIEEILTDKLLLYKYIQYLYLNVKHICTVYFNLSTEVLYYENKYLKVEGSLSVCVVERGATISTSTHAQ